MAAAQIRLNDAEQRLQTAAQNARNLKEQAEEAFNQEKDMGLTGDLNFDQWSLSNAGAPIESQYDLQANACKVSCVCRRDSPLPGF